MSRQWLAIPADDATVELVASVLEAGAATRRQASLAIAEELMVERRDAKKDIRSGAVKLAEVMAEASVLDRVAAQVRESDLPPIHQADQGDPGNFDGLLAEQPFTADEVDDPPPAREVPLPDGRTAWVPAPDLLNAALGVEDAVDEPPPGDVEPLDLGGKA